MLITCPECAKQISDQAAACPYCGNPMGRTAARQAPAQTQKKKVPLIVWLALIAVLLIVARCGANGGSSTGSSSSSSGSKKSYTEADYKAAAYTLAEEQVKKHLKAPSTAKFCKMSETSFSKDESDTYVMTGWVDAENSYGAALRTSWGIKVKVSGDKITMQKLIIGSETVYP